MTGLIDEQTLRELHDDLHGTEADIAFGHLRHIIREWERRKSAPSQDTLTAGAVLAEMGFMIGGKCPRCSKTQLIQVGIKAFPADSPPPPSALCMGHVEDSVISIAGGEDA